MNKVSAVLVVLIGLAVIAECKRPRRKMPAKSPAIESNEGNSTEVPDIPESADNVTANETTGPEPRSSHSECSSEKCGILAAFPQWQNNSTKCKAVGCCWSEYTARGPGCFEKNGLSNCPNILKADRVQCGLGNRMVDKASCNAQGCCWHPVNDLSVPWCYQANQDSQATTGEANPTITENTAPENNAPANAPQNNQVYGRPTTPPAPVNVVYPVYDQGVPQTNQQGVSQNNNQQTPPTMANGAQPAADPMSTMAQAIMMCSGSNKQLCNMAVLNLMGDFDMSPITKVPSTPTWINFILNRQTYKADKKPDFASMLLGGRINTVSASATGNSELDARCFTSAEVKQLGDNFQIGCGGFLSLGKTFTENECIDRGCCWIDDHKSRLFKALNVDADPSKMMLYSAMLGPMFGFNDTQETNCVESMSESLIQKITIMIMLLQTEHDGNLGISPEILPLLLAGNMQGSSGFSSMIMSFITQQGGAPLEMSLPMMMNMVEDDEDSTVLLPILMSLVNKKRGEARSTNARQPMNNMDMVMLMSFMNKNDDESSDNDDAGEQNGEDNASSLKNLLPLFMAMGKQEPGGQAPGGLNMLTMMSLLGNDGGSDNLPLMMSLLGQQGAQGQGAMGGLDPLTLVQLMGKDSDSSMLPIVMSLMSQAPKQPTQESQVWSAPPGVMASPSNGPQTNTQGYNPPASPMMAMAPMLLAMMGNKDEGGNEGNMMENMIPFLMMQSQSQGAQGAQGAQGGPGNDIMKMMLPTILASQQGADSNPMMTQMLLNPDIMSQPGMLPLLLSNSGNSDDSMKKMLMMAAMTSQSQGQNPQQQQLLQMMMLMPNSSDMMQTMLPVMMSQPTNGDQNNLMPMLMPMIISGMSDSNNDDDATSNMVVQMMMNGMSPQGNGAGASNPMMSMFPYLTQPSPSGSDDSLKNSLMMQMIMNQGMSPQGNGAGASNPMMAMLPYLTQPSSSGSDDSLKNSLMMQMIASSMTPQSPTGQQQQQQPYQNPMISPITQALMSSQGSVDPFLMQMALSMPPTNSQSMYDNNPSYASSQPSFNQGYTPPYGAPFANPGFPQNTNQVMGYFAGTDQERTARIGTACSFTPGAPATPCGNGIVSQQACEAQACCWDGVAGTCFKKTT